MDIGETEGELQTPVRYDVENPLAAHRGSEDMEPSSPGAPHATHHPILRSTQIRNSLGLSGIPLKTLVAAFGLFGLGICLFGASLDFYIEHPNHDGALPIFVLAIMVLCPGVYSVSIIVGIRQGWRGYHIHQLPMYQAV